MAKPKRSALRQESEMEGRKARRKSPPQMGGYYLLQAKLKEGGVGEALVRKKK